MSWICMNGKFVAAEAALVSVTDRSYRYGDGLFETVKLLNGQIVLADYHFERLWKGIVVLRLRPPAQFSAESLANEIVQLCTLNNSTDAARVRLSISAGSGGLYDDIGELQYAIECWPLKARQSFSDDGLSIDVFPDARKSCDVFSNLKTSSHLIYAVAARFAKENKLDDCLVLNAYQRVCDSSIANVFWVKDGKVYTPPLNEGCIDGVMRRYLIEKLKSTPLSVSEMPCEPGELENADEIFLTNAIQGIRRVGKMGGRELSSSKPSGIYKRIAKMLQNQV